MFAKSMSTVAVLTILHIPINVNGVDEIKLIVRLKVGVLIQNA